MQAQWERAAGIPGNGRRRIMVTARVNGLFTRGHSPGQVDIDRKIMNQDVQEGIYGRTVIKTASRPYADLPFEARVRTNKVTVCPGCGIKPPTGRGTTDQGKIQCQNCW
jgi:hypothetical protein